MFENLRFSTVKNEIFHMLKEIFNFLNRKIWDFAGGKSKDLSAVGKSMIFGAAKFIEFCKL
jgi:hypothetical protein